MTPDERDTLRIFLQSIALQAVEAQRWLDESNTNRLAEYLDDIENDTERIWPIVERYMEDTHA